MPWRYSKSLSIANGRVVTACHASNTIVSAKMLSSFGILTSGPDSRQNANLRHHSFGDISDIEALTFCRQSLRHLIGGFQHLRIFLRQRFCTTKAMPRSQQRSRTFRKEILKRITRLNDLTSAVKTSTRMRQSRSTGFEARACGTLSDIRHR